MQINMKKTIHLQYLHILLLLFSLFFFFSAKPVSANLGVGVDTGQIVVDEPLKTGYEYTLPSIKVINTGDLAGDYFVSIDYNEKSDKMKPQKDWFTLEPREFSLEPGQEQEVKISIKIPLSGVYKGGYAAFIIAQPENNFKAVGVAAGTKLFFDVKITNIFSAFSMLFYSLFTKYLLATVIVLSVALLVGLFFFLKKKLTISLVSLKKPSKKKKKS